MGIELSLGNSEFKNAFISGSFVIDCLQVKLTQNASVNPRIFKASGYFHISPENGTEGRLVIAREPTDIFNPMEDFRRAVNLKSGKLIPESDYYELEARDISGNIWTHPAVNLEKDERQDAITLKVSCDYIRTESPTNATNVFAHFIFLDELGFPKNFIQSTSTLNRGRPREILKRDASSGTAAGLKFTFDPRKQEPGEKYSDFFALSEDGVTQPVGFQDRLLEAIRFCTATMTTPVMSETCNNSTRIVELTRARPPNKGLIEAPLSSLEHGEDFYKLFECYFKYACINASGKEFAPLSAKVGGLFTLKNVWLDTIALLVGVAIEALLNEEPFKKLGKPNKTMLDEIGKMVEFVRGTSVSQGLINRVLGSIGAMKSSSASDRFHALVEAGALDEKDRSTWKRVRNATAHGSFDIDPNEFQTRLDDVYRLITVIYKLVFMRIGYCGKYSNYAEHGWLVSEFQSDIYQAKLDSREVQKKQKSN